MQIEDIQPFVRFIRYLNLSKHVPYLPCLPYDARLFFACRGSGVLRVDGTDCRMERGTLLLIHAGIRYHLPSPEEGLQLLAINFDFTRADAKHELPVQPLYGDGRLEGPELAPCHFTDIPAFNRLLYLPGQLQLESRLQHMDEIYRQKRLFYRAELSAEMLAILTGLARVAAGGIAHVDTHRADPIITWIHAHYAQPLTNAQIGAEFGFHPNYVSSLISAATGMSLHRYLLYIRISNAIDLLETTALPISAVAQQTGFDDVCYFSKYFRKLTGLSPRDYRRGRLG